MRRNGLQTAAAVIGAAAIAATIGGCAKAAGAAAGGPSKALIETLVEKGAGGEDATRRFQFTDVQVAPPRVLRYGDVYGLKAGVKAWLARTTYTMFTAAGDVTASWSTCERSENTDYFYIYKDEFGQWAAYSTSHPGTSNRGTYHGACPNMPGVGIFSTPVPSS